MKFYEALKEAYTQAISEDITLAETMQPIIYKDILDAASRGEIKYSVLDMLKYKELKKNQRAISLIITMAKKDGLVFYEGCLWWDFYDTQHKHLY